MKVRCKMVVTERRDQVNQHPGSKPSTWVKMSAASGEENKTWTQWTPSGTIELYINNPDAYAAFELGAFYFVDFEKAPAAEKDEVK